MATYAVSLGHSAQQVETAEAAETDEAATPFETWLGEDGDPDDLDNLLAFVLEHIVAAVDAPQEGTRRERFCAKPRISNRKIAAVLRQQREARNGRSRGARRTARRDHERNRGGDAGEQRAEDETQPLASRISRRRRTCSKRRSRANAPCAACSTPSAAVRIRQRIASELAKRHAAKALEVVAKSNKRRPPDGQRRTTS